MITFMTKHLNIIEKTSYYLFKINMVTHIVYYLNISFYVLPYMCSCAVAFLYLLEFIIVTKKPYNTV